MNEKPQPWVITSDKTEEGDEVSVHELANDFVNKGDTVILEDSEKDPTKKKIKRVKTVIE